ncbi:uncharacterized protein LOC117386177 isoform X2 [Periophthalmus magnuspinnatus]|uniref:uncharacterized protein LOC117386177 isoform X2 n=1 Tax=Periophthalmus magnuspinnatus TaxID=409849 RepID=UPI00145A09DE|nr:uncharacterized protein LOC117386177 isoform X2 [Periophthalmus magnuspinnatus]
MRLLLALALEFLVCSLITGQQMQPCKSPPYLMGKLLVGAMYEMDVLTSTCSKRPLRTDYQPIGIPDHATFMMPLVLGILSVPSAGVQINSWQGYTLRGEQYSKLVTEVECVPYHTIFYTEKHGEVVMVFLNSTMHRTALDDLSPPRFCPDQDAHPTGRPVDLIELVSESKARDLRRALSKLINIYMNNYSSL